MIDDPAGRRVMDPEVRRNCANALSRIRKAAHDTGPNPTLAETEKQYEHIQTHMDTLRVQLTMQRRIFER